MKKSYLPAITSLRAVAAYMVYIVHTNPFSVEKFGQSVFDFFDEFHVENKLFNFLKEIKTLIEIERSMIKLTSRIVMKKDEMEVNEIINDYLEFG